MFSHCPCTSSDTLCSGRSVVRLTGLLMAFGRLSGDRVPVALLACGVDLDRLCAFHYARQVAADNTVRVEDVVLQLLPGPRRRSHARASADVVQCLDGSWRVYVADRLVTTTPAPSDPGQLRARRR